MVGPFLGVDGRDLVSLTESMQRISISVSLIFYA